MRTSTLESRFRRWYWLFVPLLAIVAYLTVIRIGFLGDDFILLSQSTAHKIGFDSLLPPHNWFLYRPLGSLFIWDLGAHLWGYNPLPFHIQSLLFHALTSLVLGLWLAEATGRRTLGWLVGAVFAVFPLHMEAVGWIAAQWDVLSTLLGVASLWVFTLWWRKGSVWLYLASLLLYALALFTKDSLLTFLPMFALSAWLVTAHFGRKEVLRVAYSLLPFCAVLALNLGLRLAVWGNLGGYPDLPTDYGNFFWDSVISVIKVFLSPINTTVFGNTVAQMIGALFSLALLVGLILYGRKWLRLLIVTGCWLFFTLVPVLNLPIKADDLQQNRLLYLACVGYCILVGTLLYSVMLYTRRRLLAAILSGLLLLFGIVVCWAQLRPWHTASVQSTELDQELLRLIPPPSLPRHGAMNWYVENSPHDYKGAYLLHLAIGTPRYFTGEKDVPVVHEVQPATDAPIAGDSSDAFALNFVYSEKETRFHANYVAGITSAGPPPSPQEGATGLLVWDFRDCAAGVVSGWHVAGAEASCEPGADKGLTLSSRGDDPQLAGPPLGILPAEVGARFVRLRASVRYPSNPGGKVLQSQWFWAAENEKWSEVKSQLMDIRQIGIPHVYWTFIPAENAGDVISGLRFDPVDGRINAAIQWIAVDLVK